MRSPFRAARGFTLLEIAATMAMVAILMVAASYTYSKVKDASGDLSVKPALSATQLELKRWMLADNRDNTTSGYSSELVSQFVSSDPVPGVEVGTAESTGPTVVSVAWVDASTVVFAAMGATKCMVLVEHHQQKTAWGASTEQSCTASGFLNAAELINGTVDAPTMV